MPEKLAARYGPFYYPQQAGKQTAIYQSLRP
jgi:hypothetical protein